jgi:hypothetical protein
MTESRLIEECADTLRTSIGCAFPGSRAIFRGHDLHRDLKDMDWMELYVFGITGRRYSPEQLRLLHAIWTTTSYPDARLWNNRVAALAGSTRSTGALGVAAALAVSEAGIYGFSPGVAAYDFLANARRRVAQGEELTAVVEEALRTRRGIGGYGRPMVSEDERIEPIMALAKENGLDRGTHVNLAFSVDQVLREGRWRLKMNYAALTAALPMDMGFSRQEYYLYVIPIFMAGMLPCYLDAVRRPAGSLFPLSCNHNLYEGRDKRPWPAARVPKQPEMG